MKVLVSQKKYGGSEVLEIETRIRLIHGNSTSFVLETNTSLAAPGALAHRLQRRTACNTSPPALSKMADGVPK